MLYFQVLFGLCIDELDFRISLSRFIGELSSLGQIKKVGLSSNFFVPMVFFSVIVLLLMFILFYSLFARVRHYIDCETNHCIRFNPSAEVSILRVRYSLERCWLPD